MYRMVFLNEICIEEDDFIKWEEIYIMVVFCFREKLCVYILKI